MDVKVWTAGIILGFISFTFGELSDSSGLIFDESKVYSYYLEFYVDDWENQLMINYNNGQEYMPAKFTYGDIVLDSVGVRYKGNSSFTMSQNTRKKPFKIKFDKYKDYTFYDLKKLNFSNCVKDPSFMREAISYKIARRYMPAPRTAFVNLYMEGDLIGLYIQVEQVDKTFLERYFEDEDFNLYKVGDKGAGLEYLGADQALYEAKYELKTNEELNDWSAFIDMIDKLNNTSDDDFAATMSTCLNLRSCIKILAFNMVFSHFDSYTGSGRNYYFYDDSTTGQFVMIPWDQNETFGSYSNNWNVFTQDVVTISNLASRPLNRRILENDSLKQIYLNYIHHMVHGPASLDSVSAMADQLKPLIESHVLADQNKLYTDQHFTTNIENDINLGVMGSIPGVKSFSQKRNTELKIQLAKYMDPIAISHTIKKVNGNCSLWNTPNPFNLFTTIHYRVPDAITDVEIGVYNCNGMHVAALYKGKQNAGLHSCLWDARHMSPGFYSIKLTFNDYSLIQKAVIIK